MNLRNLAVLAVVSCLCGAGCVRPSSGAGTSSPDVDPLRGIHIEQRTITPSSPGSTMYGEIADGPLEAPERVLEQALTARGLVHAPGLSRVAEEVALHAPPRATVPPALVDGLMAWAGLVDPPPRLVLVELGSDPSRCHASLGPACAGAVESLLEQAQTSLPEGESVRFGVGVAAMPSGGTRMVVALLEPAIEVQPFAKSTAPGRSVLLEARLLGRRIHPRIEIIAPDGSWSKVPLSNAREPAFSAPLTCGNARGVYQVEVLTDGVHGVEVVANFPLYCGIRPPKTLEVELETLEPGVSAEQIVQANLFYLNAERERRGLPALQWDPAAARVAEAHSRDMLRNDFFGHRSPSTGEVADRFAKAGIRGAVIRENVARGYGPKGIHESLMGSPGHRVNMLADDVTHVGIGVVIGDPQTSVEGAPRPILCTQNFYRPPGGGAPDSDAQLAPQLRTMIDQRRKADGLPAVRWVERLEQGAAVLADATARSRKPKDGWDRALYGTEFRAIESHQAESIDYRSLAGLDLWSSPRLEAGLAVLRVARNGDETFLLVVLVGER